MTDDTSDEKILEKLKEHRRNIILSLYRHGELGAGKIRRINGVPRGSKELHYDTLQEWGLMELVDHQQNKGGNPERVFALTDDGEQFVEDYLVDTDAAPDAYAVKIDRALDEIAELERTVEEQADEISTLREDLHQQDDELRADIEEQLKGPYRNWLKNEILDELDDRGDE